MQEAGVASAVTYENKGGAGGTIGLAQFVNSSKGDPSALMMGGQAMVSAVELNRSAVRVQQATPLARLVAEYSVIVVPASSPYKNMAYSLSISLFIAFSAVESNTTGARGRVFPATRRWRR